MKKSFIITTILMPLLLLGMSAAPSLVMLFSKSEHRTISVVDETGVIAPALQSDSEITFSLAEKPNLQEELKRSLGSSDFGVLYIGKDAVQNPNNIMLFTNASSSMTIEEKIATQLENAIKSERIKEYDEKLKGLDIPDLKEIMQRVDTKVHLISMRNGDDGNGLISSTFAGVVGMVLGMMLYFFLAIYGAIVMSSIIEEKNSRILDVLVSTVRPFEMMMGKIVGVALVAGTQILVWGTLLVVMSAYVLPAVLPAELMSGISAIRGGADASAIAATGANINLITTLAPLLDTAYIIKIVALMLSFMMGGFLLYAAMYAAVGASVDSPQDAQQLTMPITVPIFIGLIISMTVMNDPDSSLVFWCSMIPFTSPIVMMARIPSGIPAWEIATSLVILYATFIIMVWLAGRVYRVGIFMHGVKPSLKELWRWMRY